MATEKKITKVQYFTQIAEVIENSGVENANELIEFVNKQIEQIENKALKAKERAEKVKAEGDALRELVKSYLTEEYVTADEITATINDPEVTKAKVVNRLSALIKLNFVEKATLKDESGRKVVHYRIKVETEE